MRKLVWTLLKDDTQLNSLGIDEDSLLEESAVDTPAMRPFAVTRWREDSPGIGPVSRRTLTIWVHDTPGSYKRIDDVIRRVREVLEPVVAMQDPDGGWLNQIEWRGNSEDLSDDVQGTVVRNATFLVVGSRQ